MTELSPEIRELVERAKLLDGPDARRRERVRHALFAGISSGAALSTAAHAAAHAASHTAIAAGVTKAIGSASLLTLFALGAAGGVAVAVPATLISQRDADRAVTLRHVQPPRAPVVMPDEQRASSRASQEMESLPAAVPATSGVVSSKTRAPAASSQPGRVDPPAGERGGPSPAPGSSFGAEALILQDAQLALSQGDSVVALERLSEHARRFPSGALAEEREAAFVLALCSAGRVAEARAHRATLERTAPSSPLLPRLERSCAVHSATSTNP